MKRLLLALFALAALGAGLFVFSVFLGPGESAEQAAVSAPRADDPPEAGLDPGELAEPEAVEETPAETEPENLVATVDTEPQRVAAGAGAGSLFVEGRVALPGDVVDPDLVVYFFDQEVQPRDVWGSSGVATSGRSDESVAPLAEARPDAGGAFKAAVASEGGKAWAVAAGRYLYSKHPTPIDLGSLGSDPRPVVIEPAVGAHIQGTLRPPAGADLASLVEDVEVTLKPDMQQFSMVNVDAQWLFRRELAPDAEGRFEFRAVDLARPYEVEIEADELADVVRKGLELEAGRTLAMQVELQRGATVLGRVVDAAGNGIAGAEVSAVGTVMWGFGSDKSAETESEEDGRFELRHVPPGKARLVAEREGFLESSPQKVELEDEEIFEGLVLALAAGDSIAGRVRWPDGSPAAELDVKVSFDPEAMLGMSAMNAARGASGSAETDAQGAFEVTGLGKGPFVVRVEGSREDVEHSAKRSGVKPGTRDLELELAPRPELLGRVVDAAGAPVPKFHVNARSSGGAFFMPGRARGKEFEDPEGRFALGDLEAGTWEVIVSAEGFGPSPATEVELPAPDGGEPLLIVLAPEALVAGKVLGPDGSPRAGAKVTLSVEASQTIARLAGQIEMPEALSEEDGAFTLGGLAPGTHSLLASHPDHAPSEPVSVELQGGEAAEEVVLTLRRGGTLIGEVYGKDGDPMSGGQIYIQDTATWETVMRRTDGEGMFRVEQLRPGPWQVTAFLAEMDEVSGGNGGDAEGGDMAGFMENMRFTVVEIEDGEETHVVLGAPPEDPVRLSGKVTHAGDPVAGSMITFFPDGATGFEAMKMTQVGAEGTYEVLLDQPGPYLVQVQSYGDQSGFQQQNVEFSETVPEGEEHRLDLELPVGKITGRVLGPDGDPVSSTRVTLTIDGGIAYGTFMGGQYAETSTQGDGTYSFDYLRPGTYAVAAGGAFFGGAFGTDASCGRIVVRGLSIAEGAHKSGVDFRLEKPGTLEGVVRNEAGKALAGAAVFVRDGQGYLLERFSMNTTGQDGRYTYTGLAPGEYTVSARTGELASTPAGPVRVSSGASSKLDVTLEPGTIVIVTVIDERGEDVSARVSVTDSAGREMNGMIAWSELTSGLKDGFSIREQRLGPVPPDSYQILVEADDGRSARKPLNLTGQSERRIKVRVR